MSRRSPRAVGEPRLRNWRRTAGSVYIQRYPLADRGGIALVMDGAHREQATIGPSRILRLDESTIVAGARFL
jgi:hypothetical protein